MSSTSNPNARYERAVALQLLRDDRPERWTRSDLAREVGIDQLVFRGVLAQLVIEGVAVLDKDDVVVASRCARALDRLGLVAV
jgi:hypothetical protein